MNALMRIAVPVCLTVLVACGDSDGTGVDDWEWELPEGFPVPRVPEDNPMSAAKVELGRHLFYDVRLSGEQSQACASCHRPNRAFTVETATVDGSTGDAGVRNPMALVNVAYNTSQTWANPVLLDLEDQATVPIFGEFPVELGAMNREDEILDRLMADPVYREGFAEAFPEVADPDFHEIIQAIAAFERTLISGDSPVDRYTYQGDRDALTDSELRGMGLFFSEELECHHCHGGFNYAQGVEHENSGTIVEMPFFNTGLYDIDGLGAYPAPNTGLHDLTGKGTDMGRFKPPTLRNIAVTGPYMHDGSVETLEEVIDIYARGGRLIEEGPFAGDGARNRFKNSLVGGFELSETDKADLLAFLNALTDETFLNDPSHSDPWQASE